MFRLFAMASHQNNQLTFEAIWHRQADKPFFSPVKRQGPDGNEANAHAYGDERYDKIEIIQLNRGVYFQI